MTFTHIAGRDADGKPFLFQLNVPESDNYLVARARLQSQVTESLGAPPRCALIAIQGGKAA